MRYLVCAFTGHFADDVPARCATCDAAIVHRPHVPPDCTTICAACAGKLFESSDRPPRVLVTEKTLREVELYCAKTRGTQ